MRRLTLAILGALLLAPQARAQVPIQPNAMPLVTQTNRGAVPPTGTPAGKVLTDAASWRALTFADITGKLSLATTTTTATDDPLISLSRTTSHSGGAFGYVDFVEKIYLKVNAPVVNFEWAFTAIIDNYAANGENVAGYFQANKFANGPTWAGVFECSDKTITPSSVNGALPCIEVDVGAAGLDDYPPVGLRGGITIGINSQSTTTPTEVGWGVRVTDSQYASYRRAFYVGGKFNEAGFDTSQGTPTSRGGVTAAAFRSGSNQIWDFSGTNAAYWWLNSGTMQYVANGLAQLNIANNGAVTAGNSFNAPFMNAAPTPGLAGYSVVGTIGSVGFDTSASTLSGPAFRSKAGQAWDFSGSNVATWTLLSGTLQYAVNGIPVYAIKPNGETDSITAFAAPTFVATPAAGQVGVQVTGTTGAAGFDTTNATLTTGAAVRISAGQVICMEAFCQRTLSYDTVLQNLNYSVAGTPVFTVGATGNAIVHGAIALAHWATGGEPSTQPAGSIGYDTTRAAPVFYDGTAWAPFGGGSGCPASLNGCTGSINSGGHSILFGGNFTTAGNNSLTFTTTGATNITLPPVSDTPALLGQNNNYTGYQTVQTVVTPNQTTAGVDWAGFFKATSSVGADSQYFDFGIIGQYNDINTAPLSGAAHRAGGLLWYQGGVGVTLGTRPLVIGGELKIDLVSGAYGVAQGAQCNVNTIAAVISYIEIDGCASNILAALAGGGTSTIAAFAANFVGPASGVTLPFYVGNYFKVPTGTGPQGSITTTIANYMPSWASYSGYANLPQMFYGLNQEVKARFQTAGQIFGAYGSAAEVGPTANAGMVSGRYYFGVHPSGAVNSSNLPATGSAPIGVFYSPARQTFTKVSLVITTPVAASNVEFALYNISAGTLTTVVCSGVIPSATASTATAPTEVTGLNCPLEAGSYAVVLNSSTASPVGISFMTDSGPREVFGDTGLGSLVSFYITKAYGTGWPASPTLSSLAGLYAFTNPLVGFRF